MHPGDHRGLMRGVFCEQPEFSAAESHRPKVHTLLRDQDHRFTIKVVDVPLSEDDPADTSSRIRLTLNGEGCLKALFVLGVKFYGKHFKEFISNLSIKHCFEVNFNVHRP